MAWLHGKLNYCIGACLHPVLWHAHNATNIAPNVYTYSAPVVPDRWRAFLIEVCFLLVDFGDFIILRISPCLTVIVRVFECERTSDSSRSNFAARAYSRMFSPPR